MDTTGSLIDKLSVINHLIKTGEGQKLYKQGFTKMYGKNYE
jgi:hypothetical protein